MAKNTSYTVDYSDKRFTEVEADKNQALNQLNKTYDSMISQSDKYYQNQIDASKQWAETQKQNQQEQTDFAIEQIEQQKAQAEQDYTKEQSGAYVDWQKQSGEYGANAEMMAAQGMTGTGFSESSQVSMYNTYQNRVATARESYQRAVLNYDNAIKDARLQNNALLAEIAYKALQEQLELSLAGFQYKNELLLAKTDKQLEVDEMYYNRYQDVLEQINTENAMAEQIRQFNMEYELKEKEYEEGIRQFNEEIKRLKAKDAQENAMEIKKLELQRDSLKEEQRQFNAQMAEQKRQFNVKNSSSSSSDGTTLTKTKTKISGKKNTSSNSVYDSKGAKNTIKNTVSLAIQRGNTSRANQKLKSLQSMSSMMSNKNNNALANSIVAYLGSSDINKNEAAYMLDKIGKNPNKYLNF